MIEITKTKEGYTASATLMVDLGEVREAEVLIDGKTHVIYPTVSVKGAMRMFRDILFEGTESAEEFDKFLEQYTEYALLSMVGLEQYPLRKTEEGVVGTREGIFLEWDKENAG